MTLYVTGDNKGAHTCSCIFSTSVFYLYWATWTGLSLVYSKLNINPLVWFFEAGQSECTFICLLESHVSLIFNRIVKKLSHFAHIPRYILYIDYVLIKSICIHTHSCCECVLLANHLRNLIVSNCIIILHFSL